MRLRPAAVSKLRRKVDGAIEVEAAIRKNIDPLSLEVGRSIDNTNLTSLNEVIGDKKILLIW